MRAAEKVLLSLSYRPQLSEEPFKATVAAARSRSETKPSLLWVFRQAGDGYSSPTIVGGTLYRQGAADDTDFAFALDTEPGKLPPKQQLGPMFVQDRGNGPRGAVSVAGDSLYLIRGGGELLRLAAANGKPVWRKDLRGDLGGALMSQWVDRRFVHGPRPGGLSCGRSGAAGQVLGGGDL